MPLCEGAFLTERYRLLRPLGEGAEGAIWEAEQLGLEGFRKIVALKLVAIEAKKSKEARRRLIAEARLVAQIRHPHIIEIFDVGETEEWVYIAMERIHGLDLERVCAPWEEKKRPFPWPFAVRLVADACKGLYAAYTFQGATGQPLHLVHRDLKPQNLLVDQHGFVKVIDFGIAKAPQQENLTLQGVFKGTPAYMSPEQIHGAGLDGRSDLFSLGIVLYRMCCGRLPFLGPSPHAFSFQISFGEPPSPRSLQADLPEKLEEIILRLLEKKPADRFADAKAAQKALESLLHEERKLLGYEEIAAFLQPLLSDPALSAASFEANNLPPVMKEPLDNDDEGPTLAQPVRNPYLNRTQEAGPSAEERLLTSPERTPLGDDTQPFEEKESLTPFPESNLPLSLAPSPLQSPSFLTLQTPGSLGPFGMRPSLPPSSFSSHDGDLLPRLLSQAEPSSHEDTPHHPASTMKPVRLSRRFRTFALSFFVLLSAGWVFFVYFPQETLPPSLSFLRFRFKPTSISLSFHFAPPCSLEGYDSGSPPSSAHRTIQLQAEAVLLRCKETSSSPGVPPVIHLLPLQPTKSIFTLDASKQLRLHLFRKDFGILRITGPHAALRLPPFGVIGSTNQLLSIYKGTYTFVVEHPNIKKPLRATISPNKLTSLTLE